mmetsp:Transcript_64376/g.122811  ORF Transcript_64376/g.122811 Transcript_64376/m.122811 type:complete len:309 (-) Transcript_64376:4-930(-)
MRARSATTALSAAKSAASARRANLETTACMCCWCRRAAKARLIAADASADCGTARLEACALCAVPFLTCRAFRANTTSQYCRCRASARARLAAVAERPKRGLGSCDEGEGCCDSPPGMYAGDAGGGKSSSATSLCGSEPRSGPCPPSAAGRDGAGGREASSAALLGDSAPSRGAGAREASSATLLGDPAPRRGACTPNTAARRSSRDGAGGRGACGSNCEMVASVEVLRRKFGMWLSPGGAVDGSRAVVSAGTRMLRPANTRNNLPAGRAHRSTVQQLACQPSAMAACHEAAVWANSLCSARLPLPNP